MVNANYQAGVRLERDIVNAFKEAGWGACRTAGSKSKYDVIAWTFDPERDESDRSILEGLGFLEIEHDSYYDYIYTRETQRAKHKLFVDIFYDENRKRSITMIQCKRSKIK